MSADNPTSEGLSDANRLLINDSRLLDSLQDLARIGATPEGGVAVSH
ncbi:hypothetical protein [Orrella marina]|nr:hypothetical protein [Orrella marina]